MKAPEAVGAPRLALCGGFPVPCVSLVLWLSQLLALAAPAQPAGSPGQIHPNAAREGSSSLCSPGTFWATRYLLADPQLNAFKLYL